jgi:hypothetical protein
MLPAQPFINTPLEQLPHPFTVMAGTEPTMPSASAQPPTAAANIQATPTRTGKRRQGARSKNKKPSEWEQHKQVMADLYMKENKPLPNLRQIMRENFGFEASPKQYKTQFAAWGWSKNFTHDLARYMNDVHNRRLRKGKASSQFVWRNQIWTVEAAQKLLTEEELEKSQNEALNIPTPRPPFGITVETPLPTSSPNVIDPPEPLAPEPERPEPERPRLAAGQGSTAIGASTRPIRLRYKGYTIQDIEKIHHAAHDFEANDDYEPAKNKFCELLDVSKHLLPEGTETYRNLVYEVACFFARNEDMEMADNVLDNLSEECIRRWGAVHEHTLNHYATVGKLLVQWDRHSDAVGIFKRMAENLPILARLSTEGPKQGLTSQPGAFHSYVDVNNQSLQDSVHAIVEEHVEESSPSTLTMLQEQLKLDRGLNNDEGSSEEAILQLLNKLEENPTENAAAILRARCLLVTFYNKADMPDQSAAALSSAKDSALSLCKRNINLTTAFFHTSIHLAQTLFEVGQQTAVEQLLNRLQQKFTDNYGPDHPDTISLLIRIGKMFQRQKRWGLARPRFEAAFAGAMHRFGVLSPLAKRLESCLENRQYPFEPNADEDSTFFPIVTL